METQEKIDNLKNQRDFLEKYKESLSKLSPNEWDARNLYLKKIANGELYGPHTGYPSIDKPWLKYHTDESIVNKDYECTMFEFLRKRNENNMENIAINYFGNRITYRKLFKNIDKCASMLQNLGVKENDIVTFCMPTTPETIYLIYALNKLGAIPNMVDLRINKEMINKYIKNTNSKLVIAYNGVLNKLEIDKDCKIISLNSFESLPFTKKIIANLFKFNKKSKQNNILYYDDLIKNSVIRDIPQNPYKKNSSAAIVYTGGTTGIQKGALLTNEGINNFTNEYILTTGDVIPGDKFLDIMPPFIAYGFVNGLHFSLAAGCETIIIPKFDVNKFSDYIIKYKPEFFMGVPTHYKYLMKDKKLKKFDLSFIKSAGCGGDSIAPVLEEKVNEFLLSHGCKSKLRVGYGMTENSAASILDLDNESTKIGSVGVPLPNVNISVKNENKEDIHYDELGELYISSPAMIKEYYNNPLETEKTIIKDNNVSWIKTGDIGKVDKDGHIYVTGRIKSMFLRPDGHNVYPDVITSELYKCDIIKDVCVVGLQSKEDIAGKIPTAFVVLNDDVTDLDYARDYIFDFQSHIFSERDGALDILFLSELPRTSIGKVDFMKLSNYRSNINFDEVVGKKQRKLSKK